LVVEEVEEELVGQDLVVVGQVDLEQEQLQ
jgi:hypothetical protein